MQCPPQSAAGLPVGLGRQRRLQPLLHGSDPSAARVTQSVIGQQYTPRQQGQRHRDAVMYSAIRNLEGLLLTADT